jgi:hypothetical protein
VRNDWSKHLKNTCRLAQQFKKVQFRGLDRAVGSVGLKATGLAPCLTIRAHALQQLFSEFLCLKQNKEADD